MGATTQNKFLPDVIETCLMLSKQLQDISVLSKKVSVRLRIDFPKVIAGNLLPLLTYFNQVRLSRYFRTVHDMIYIGAYEYIKVVFRRHRLTSQ